MQSAKVILACILGAFLGALTGIHFGHLWIAAITGAVLGYCSFEWHAALTALPRAWNYAAENRASFKEGILNLLRIWGSMLNVFMPTFFACILALFFPHMTDSVAIIGIIISVATMMLPIFHMVSLIQESKDVGNTSLWMPLYYWISDGPKFFLSGARKFFKQILSGLKFLYTFVTHWFRLVHSELRLLCMIDAAIGAGVGYHFHNPVIGGIVGAVFGFLNYEILSIRVMKLVPVQQSIFACFS